MDVLECSKYFFSRKRQQKCNTKRNFEDNMIENKQLQNIMENVYNIDLVIV